MADYVAIYSRRDQIQSRTGERFSIPNIEIAQRNTDSKINSALRSHLGQFDVNNFRILLPLNGTTELINDYAKTYQAEMNDDIKSIGDDLTIALLNSDFSENSDRIQPAMDLLNEYLVEHFGMVTGSLLDFTSDFIRATKIISISGKYIAIKGTNKVLAAIAKSSNTNIVNNTTS